MTGIIDYARTELRPFSELPFNEIDALIIATLIYEDVANICPTLMLDEQQQSGSFATRIRTFEPKHPLIWLKRALASGNGINQPQRGQPRIASFNRYIGG